MKKKHIFIALILINLISVAEVSALDLKFTSAIQVSPESITGGTVITFTVSFTPQGGNVTNFRIIGGVDETRIFERTYASIPADRRRTDRFNWTAVAGSHAAWFELDPDHRMGDSNYSNNRIEHPMNIGGLILESYKKPSVELNTPPVKPDLEITNVKFTKDANRNDRYFFAITIMNKGDGCIAAFNYKMSSVSLPVPISFVSCSSCPEGRIDAIPPQCALKAGQSKAIRGIVLKSDFTAASWDLCHPATHARKFNDVLWIVDYENEVDESNENNNRTTIYRLMWEDCPSSPLP